MNKTLLIIIVICRLSSVHCFAQWSAPVDISPSAISAGLNESMGSCLGVYGDTVHVVWTDKINTTHAVIYYTRSLDAGITWSPEVPISAAGGNSWNPAIAVNGASIHVVWREIDTVTNRRSSWYKRSLDGGATWSSNVFLDSTADWPGVAATGNMVYMVNDVVVSQAPYNTEIFFMRSLDNGATWQVPVQLTNAVGRSEDEAVAAQGSKVHMSWNDNRTGQFQILYKESDDYGATWGTDMVVDTPFDYNTMVSIDGAHADVIACGAPTGRYQLLLAQSPDTGATWTIRNNDLSNDTAHTYYLPYMTRDDCELHIMVGSSAGAKYFHSVDGGATWDVPTLMFSSGFIAYSGSLLHVIGLGSGHVKYVRNPTGNGSVNCTTTAGSSLQVPDGGISVSPNPFTTRLTIRSTTNTQSTITLFDYTGKETLCTTSNAEEAVLNTEGIAAGFYLLRVEGGGGVANYKVVKADDLN
jgi:hypothetical protein